LNWNSTFAVKPDAARSKAKPRTVKCGICKEPYVKQKMGQRVCGPYCAAIAGKRATEKNERKADKAKLLALEPLEYFLKQTEAACNAYIRYRDKDDPCISCGRSDATVWNAGHYISVGANRTLRFDEDNINKQCARPCNKDLGGNLIKYRPNLIVKIGLERVARLEGWHEPVKMTREYAQAKTAYFRAKLKELKKAGD
jgi:hypothetical protein